MNSRQLAGLIGPTLTAIGATEALNMHIFENQIAPVVYLNGTILFVVGLALIRAHNRWAWKWPTFITVTGYVLLVGGLFRMIAPEAPKASANVTSYTMFAAIVLMGLFLSYQGYRSVSVPKVTQAKRESWGKST
jgi:membrane-bound ClpP family serine protease